MKATPIAVFVLMLAAAMVSAGGGVFYGFGWLPLGDFRGVVMAAAWIVLFYVFAILIFRLFQAVLPLKIGEIAENSRDEFIYHVYLLFYLMVFNPVMFSGLLPVPLARVFYQALGARMGANSFPVGVILDPQFVTLGSNTIIGNGALLIPHVLEGRRLAHHPIVIGDNVTIGARSVVLSGVTIDDGATVAIGAVVAKGAHIGPREVWGGIPAQCLQRKGA
jgi:hypothetical protein